MTMSIGSTIADKEITIPRVSLCLEKYHNQQPENMTIGIYAYAANSRYPSPDHAWGLKGLTINATYKMYTTITSCEIPLISSKVI